ncbi:polysaccharide biosynthesis/export family protein [Emticicia sp.]|uniref:polysaccharide biosynthesis/export family protein n=1 Tax=Emticicia sp. TaxID=1930953 RepID=UPI00375335FC
MKNLLSIKENSLFLAILNSRSPMIFYFKKVNTTKNIFLIAISAVFINLSSCTTIQRVPPPKLGYFQTDSVSYPAYISTQKPKVTVIQKDDILAIIVNSLNVESNEILNFTNVNTLPVSVFSGNVGGGVQPLGYPVDSLGFVNIPLIGKLALGGLTLQKAEELIKTELEKSIKSPVVNLRFMNHKFSMLGEVNGVGTFNLLDDRTTIIDAIALAGDLSIFAKRDSIVVIRNIDNKREIGLVNISDRSVFASPYFYLRNGDIIYVEPTKHKLVPEIPFQQQPPPSLILQRLPLYLSLVSFLAIIANLFK